MCECVGAVGVTLRFPGGDVTTFNAPAFEAAMADGLGVGQGQVKVTDVREGSVVVDFLVLPPANATAVSAAQVAQVKAGIESGRIALAPELGLGGFEVVKVVDQRPPEEGKEKAVGSPAAAPEAAEAAEAEAAEDRYRPMYNVAAAVLVPLVTIPIVVFFLVAFFANRRVPGTLTYRNLFAGVFGGGADRGGGMPAFAREPSSKRTFHSDANEKMVIDLGQSQYQSSFYSPAPKTPRASAAAERATSGSRLHRSGSLYVTPMRDLKDLSRL